MTKFQACSKNNTEMKRFFYCFMSILPMAAIMTGCGENPVDTETHDPQIIISDVTSTVNSVSFVLTTEDADAYAYACITEAEYDDGGYQLTRKEGATEGVAIDIVSLAAETKYKIVAVAYYGDQESEPVVNGISTLPEEIVKPVLAISGITADITTVSFELSHTGTATSYHWAVYPEGGLNSAVFSTITEISENHPTGITAENLTPETVYYIMAYAAAGDVESDRVTSDPVSTLPEPVVPKAVVVTISDITHTGAMIKAERDTEVCRQYYIGASVSSSLTVENVFESIDDYPDDYLKTSDIEGSLCSELYVGMWGDSSLTMETEYTVWVVACDLDGNFAKDESSIDFYTFTTQGVPVGSAAIDVSVLSVFTNSIRVQLTPSGNTVKYHYNAYTKAMYNANNYASNAALITALIRTSTPNDTASKEYEFTSLSANTEYYICAVAVDAEGLYSVPVRILQSTKDFDYTSSVTLAPVYISGESDYGKSVFSTGITDMSAVANIRVAFCTPAQYDQGAYFSGSDDILKTKLSNATYPVEKVTPGGSVTNVQLNLVFDFSAAGKVTVSGSNHAPGTNFRFYSMVEDTQGKLTEWQRVNVQTGTYDLGGTARSTTEIVGYRQDDDGFNWTVYTLKVTPTSNTQEFWVALITPEVASGKTPVQITQYCMTDYQSQQFTGNAAQELEVTVYGSKYLLWVLCKDENGKFNNISTDATAVTDLPNMY